jgi:hypothetical protein
LKEEVKRRGLLEAAGENFAIRVAEQAPGELDVAAVKQYLGDCWRRFEGRHVSIVIRIKATTPLVPGAPRVLYRNTNSHALFAAEIQSFARENMALSAVSAVVSSSWLLRAAAFQKAPLQIDICRFEFYMPSQPVRSLQRKNRRYLP